MTFYYIKVLLSPIFLPTVISWLLAPLPAWDDQALGLMTAVLIISYCVYMICLCILP